MSVERVRSAVERRDLAALVEAMAPDVVFHRPATMRPVVGREAVAELLAALMVVFEDFRYVAVLGGVDDAPESLAPVSGPLHGLVFRATVSGEPVEGIDLLTFDDTGQVTNFVVMMRPLAGLLAIADAVGAQMIATSGSVQ
ncbi:nuclear transport factor 2 family protein [Asanoa sp. WMMD1127]|uniref:nuclear transport factor 2 family protein n=1 Tax=Asanoa sp. WMMD1127 TaxID=3016107 RepID=UPI002416A04B|nr:nuclear transport factor 2 family protein [Asanoa sp. WMMD1127]MDG4820742.1 nuclear transport factor 2 family protein [Asanoa sp. WMMD1127]